MWGTLTETRAAIPTPKNPFRDQLKSQMNAEIQVTTQLRKSAIFNEQEKLTIM